jgi:hypothetical protein
MGFDTGKLFRRGGMFYSESELAMLLVHLVVTQVFNP